MSESEIAVFVDTNLLVYAYDLSAGRKRDRARSLLDQLWAGRRGCLSVQVLQEFYVAVTQKVDRPIEPPAAAEVIRDLSYWRIHAPVAADVLGAIELQQRYQASFWDSMILWSAKQLECGELWSEDLNPGQDFDGVTVVNPFES